MYEENPVFRGKPLQQLARTDLMVFKALELSHRPGYERLIDGLTCRSKGYSADGAYRP